VAVAALDEFAVTPGRLIRNSLMDGGGLSFPFADLFRPVLGRTYQLTYRTEPAGGGK